MSIFRISRNIYRLQVIAHSHNNNVMEKCYPTVCRLWQDWQLCDSNCNPGIALRSYCTDSCKTDVETFTDAPLVYRGNLTVVIKAAKFFSITSSAMGLAVQPSLLKASATLHPAVLAVAGSLICFFTYVTPFLLHWITKKYVTELRLDPETNTFECTTLTFFARPQKMTFQASDVEVPDVPGLFTSLLAKGKPLFVDLGQFSDIDAYKHLMGYDKPLDLKLGNCDDAEKPTDVKP